MNSFEEKLKDLESEANDLIKAFPETKKINEALIYYDNKVILTLIAVIREQRSALLTSHKMLCQLAIEEEPPSESDKLMVGYVFDTLQECEELLK